MNKFLRFLKWFFDTELFGVAVILACLAVVASMIWGMDMGYVVWISIVFGWLLCKIYDTIRIKLEIIETEAEKADE